RTDMAFDMSSAWHGSQGLQPLQRRDMSAGLTPERLLRTCLEVIGADRVAFGRLARDEVDRHRHAFQLEAFAQLVLDPVAVVAGHEPPVVDREAEARWARRDLRAVQEVQSLAVPGRRLPPLAQLREDAVQLR